MGKYCVNCGNELHIGARFCGKCGAPVASAARPAPQPAYTRQRSLEAAKKKKGANALCIVLVILLAVQTIVVALYGWPGFAVGGKIKPPVVLESNSFTLQEGQTAIKADNGVTIDFGCLLEAGEEITVEKVKPSRVDSEVEIYAYNFELSSGQPEGAIELTIPYDDADLGADEELLSVCGKYLNEQTGEWEDVFYTVDVQANEVHIITDHLSTYSAFKIMNPTKRSAYISDVNVYAAYMTMEQADALLKTYAAQGPTWQEDVTSSFLSATGTLEYFIESNMHTLLCRWAARMTSLSASRFKAP